MSGDMLAPELAQSSLMYKRLLTGGLRNRTVLLEILSCSGRKLTHFTMFHKKSKIKDLNTHNWTNHSLSIFHK